MSKPMFLTLNEVIERYRGQISDGTLRNWRSKRVGPSLKLAAIPITSLMVQYRQSSRSYRIPPHICLARAGHNSIPSGHRMAHGSPRPP